jgi:hypothetical protein
MKEHLKLRIFHYNKTHSHVITCSDSHIIELQVTVSQHLADQGHNVL